MPASPELLKSIEMFSTFTQEELEKIAPLVNPMKVMEGEILAKRGYVPALSLLSSRVISCFLLKTVKQSRFIIREISWVGPPW
jgi:hypothetical protein